MCKSNYLSSKSVFGQLISLIDDKKIKHAVKKTDSDRYVKRFKTKEYLISIVFCSFVKCNSLREVSGAMLGLSGKTESFQLGSYPNEALYRTQIRIERLCFLKIFTILCFGNMVWFSRTAEFKMF